MFINTIRPIKRPCCQGSEAKQDNSVKTFGIWSKENYLLCKKK
jgi:hypothetical protein